MKHTMLYLKYLVIILLIIAMVFSGICGICLVLAGLFLTLLNKTAETLLLLVPGLFCGFMCAVAVDCTEYLTDKWS